MPDQDQDGPAQRGSEDNCYNGCASMKPLCFAVVLFGCLGVSGQNDSAFDLQGILELVDQPSDPTPVEALTFRLHPLSGGFDIEARPNRDGEFTVNLHTGRYALIFPMPGRVQTFALGSTELSPQEFELSSGRAGPLRLVVSMKTGEVAVSVRGISSGRSDVVAALVPADNRLTLRESCYSNGVTDSQTAFRFVPTGGYRILVVDVQLLESVTMYATRFPDFLKNEATPVEVPASGQVAVTATYVDSATVKEAIQRAH